MGALLAAFLRRRVRDKGLRNGSSVWLIVGAFGVLRRMYRFFAPKNETIRLGERLRPGDDLVVRYPGQPNRKVRKEQKLVAARRVAAQTAHEQQKAALAAKAEGTGRRARKAERALASLAEPRV
jgi:hypothetical protein